MRVRHNIDDIFAKSVPAAVIRGDADTCLYAPRPCKTYFKDGNVESFTRVGPKIKG